MSVIKPEKKYSTVLTVREILLLRTMIKNGLTTFPNARFFEEHTRDEVIEMLGNLYIQSEGGEPL